MVPSFPRRGQTVRRSFTSRLQRACSLRLYTLFHVPGRDPTDSDLSQETSAPGYSTFRVCEGHLPPQAMRKPWLHHSCNCDLEREVGGQASAGLSCRAFLNVTSSHVLPLRDAPTLPAPLAVGAWKLQVRQAPLLAGDRRWSRSVHIQRPRASTSHCIEWCWQTITSWCAAASLFC